MSSVQLDFKDCLRPRGLANCQPCFRPLRTFDFPFSRGAVLQNVDGGDHPETRRYKHLKFRNIYWPPLSLAVGCCRYATLSRRFQAQHAFEVIKVPACSGQHDNSVLQREDQRGMIQATVQTQLNQTHGGRAEAAKACKSCL